MKRLFLKRNTLILIFSSFLSFQAKAQWVTIPDSALVVMLTQSCPAAMNGNQMDTTSSLILSFTNFYCAQRGIKDLEGLEYFDNLTILTCRENQITHIPRLPAHLKEFYCNDNLLTQMPALPASIAIFHCNNNQLTQLPQLPDSLIEFRCHNNLLDSIPVLPHKLTHLECGVNNLISLPTLPDSLLLLDIHANDLTVLPALPSGLKRLDCSFNHLRTLPALPDSLRQLFCSLNQLNTLPILPSKLINLYCQDNPLFILPALPASLRDLNCSYSTLSSLPALPNLIYMFCQYCQLEYLPALPSTLLICDFSHNRLSCLPSLPNSLTSFYDINITSNLISCLPNHISAMTSWALNLPLCEDNEISNPNTCAGVHGVLGKFFNDMDADCMYDNLDEGLVNVPVKLLDNTGSLINTQYTFNGGDFNFLLDTATYSLVIDTVNMPFSINCVSPGIDSTFSLTTLNPLIKNMNFSATCKPGFDLGVRGIEFSEGIVPGLSQLINIDAGDMSKWFNFNCAGGIGGLVTVTISGPVSLDSIPYYALTPSSVGNKVYTYLVSDFATISKNSFSIWSSTDTTAQLGDSVCITVSIVSTLGDYNLSNNNYSYCKLVRSSFDPNEKEVYPASVPAAYSDYLTYTIHFQNVGNAPAKNVKIIDTLSTDLDINTFEIMGYSHKNTTTLKDNKVVFRFPGIQLPDSAANTEGSSGFIQYRIKPIAGLPFASQISNTAHIFFDFNQAVVTNTAVVHFDNSTGINKSAFKQQLTIYPNPGQGIFYVGFGENKIQLKTIEIFNLMGERVYVLTSTSEQLKIDIRDLPDGMYILQARDAQSEWKQKIVKN